MDNLSVVMNGEETPLPLRRLFIIVLDVLRGRFGRENDVSVIAAFVRYLDAFELSLLVAIDKDGEFGGDLSGLIGGPEGYPLGDDFAYLVPVLRIILHESLHEETTTFWLHSPNLAAIHSEWDYGINIDVYSWEGNILPGSSYHDPHRLTITELEDVTKDRYSPSCLCGCSPCHEECPLHIR
jgi:hypothetical protein